MSDIAADVRRVFGDPGAVAERLQASRMAASAQPMRDGDDDDPVVAATRRERRRAVGAGINGLMKLADGRDAELNDAERFGLRAIVQLEARPALLVQDGDFAEPPPEWARLAPHRERIREVIARSGRIEVAGHVELDWIGTASLVAPETLMTNRHVAEEFCSRDGAAVALRPHMT
jgi:hypothetical protein